MTVPSLARIFVSCLLTAAFHCIAGPLAGTWETEKEIDGQPVSYQVIFSEKGSRLSGAWTTEGRLSAAGCLRGSTARKQVAVLSICTLDGSSGARDSDSVCPQYASGGVRFAVKGTALVWETKSSKSGPWQSFVALERAPQEHPLRWPIVCGPRNKISVSE